MPSQSNVHVEESASAEQVERIRELSNGRWNASAMTYLAAKDALRYLEAWAKPPEPEPPYIACWVYVIQAGGVGGPLKVGFAADPEQRLAELQIGNHLALEIIHQVPGGRELEERLHRKLATHRIRGEWFVANLKTIRIIGGVLSEVQVK